MATVDSSSLPVDERASDMASTAPSQPYRPTWLSMVRRTALRSGFPSLSIYAATSPGSASLT